MLQQPDTAGGVIASSSPGVVYTILVALLDVPLEKWVSAVTLIFIILQVIFLLKDRLKKRRARKEVK